MTQFTRRVWRSLHAEYDAVYTQSMTQFTRRVWRSLHETQD